MPTSTDYDHAAFVRQEYRYYPASNAATKTRNPSAQEAAQINTNLDKAGAMRVANAILAENVQPRAFEIPIEGMLGGDPLLGSPPVVSIYSAKWGLNGYQAKAFSISEDYDRNVTTLQVRG